MEPAVVVRIHPGQSQVSVPPVSAAMMAISTALRCVLLGLAMVGPAQLRAQVRAAPAAAGRTPAADSTRLLKRAREAQARFEWERMRLSPVARTSSREECDERVGRMCFWYDESDRLPEPEPPGIAPLRDRLLGQLDSVGARLPGDEWVLGQRVWYRAEAGRWTDALEVARDCGPSKPWWCDALEGFALHGLGRFEEAGEAFDRALALMDSTRAGHWRALRTVVDGGVRKLLGPVPADSLALRLRQLWMLADPLYLVPGNDRETAHYARRTVARVREDAHNPHGLRWGSDLEELLVRNGWEVGWERHRVANPVLERDGAVGYTPPQGRSYLPSGKVLSAPWLAGPKDLEADEGPAQSLYAPSYAPVLLPAEAQVAVFPRGDRFAVVATSYLPADTSSGPEGVGAPTPLDPDPLAGGPDQVGLFLVPLAGGRTRSRILSGGTSGRFFLEAPAGRYLVSAESWSPARRRAGRLRMGLVEDSVPGDVATLSDLLLLEAWTPEPHTLEAALPYLLVSTTLESRRRIAVAWEVSGLGWRPEDVTYRLSVDRVDRGLLGRAGRWLHITGENRTLALSWSEPGPARPRPQFHWLALQLPELDPGRYEVRLEARISMRSALVSRRTFEVVRDGKAPAGGGAPYR